VTKLVDPELLSDVVTIVTENGRATIPQAAVLIGVHPQTARSLVENGYLQTIRIGARKFVLLEEISRYKREGNFRGEEGEGSQGSSSSASAPALNIDDIHSYDQYDAD
jgi:hypothetical protein